MRRLPILALVIALFALGMVGGWALRTYSKMAGQGAPAESDSDLNRPVEASEKEPLPPSESVDRLRQIYSTGNGTGRARLIAELADDLDAGQIRAALSEMEKTHFPEKRELRVQLIARLARLDPSVAMQYAKSIKVSYERDELIRAAVKGWMEVDAVRASAWALAQKPPLKESALRGLTGALADTDPKAAFDLILKVGQGPDDALAEQLFDQWTERDPAEAGAHAARLPKGLLREQAMSVVATRWASRDIPGALVWAETMWDQSLSRNEGRSYPSGGDAMSAVLQVWLRQDPDATLQWIHQLPDEKKREAVMANLMAVESNLDPEKTAEFITTKLEPGELQDRTLGQLIVGWSMDDAKSALAWVQQQPDPRVQQMLLPGMALGLPSEGAQDVIALAEKLGGEQREPIIRSALMSWARSDPGAAAAWVDRQPANQHYYYNVAYSWMRRDSKAATAWVERLPASATKEAFFGHAAAMMQFNYLDPSTIISWADKISDRDRRSEAYMNTARAWLKHDTEAAQAWLRTAPLDQRSKDQLLGANAK